MRRKAILVPNTRLAYLGRIAFGRCDEGEYPQSAGVTNSFFITTKKLFCRTLSGMYKLPLITARKIFLPEFVEPAAHAACSRFLVSQFDAPDFSGNCLGKLGELDSSDALVGRQPRTGESKHSSIRFGSISRTGRRASRPGRAGSWPPGSSSPRSLRSSIPARCGPPPPPAARACRCRVPRRRSSRGPS
jgi:hypothetical protein